MWGRSGAQGLKEQRLRSSSPPRSGLQGVPLQGALPLALLRAETGCQVGRGVRLAPPTPTAAPAEPILQEPGRAKKARLGPAPSGLCSYILTNTRHLGWVQPWEREELTAETGPQGQPGTSGSWPLLCRRKMMFLLEDFVSKSLHFERSVTI